MKFILVYVLGIIFQPLNADFHQEARMQEIHSLKNHYHPLILQEQENHPEFFQRFQTLLKTGEMHPAEDGNGGTYILKDTAGNPHFVIKPTDEDIYCLNNPKQYSSSSLDTRARKNIPLYHSSPREAFCYELAILSGLEAITPKTHLSILSHPQFFHLAPTESLEKLCSVADYIQESTPLFFLLQNLFSLSLTDQDLEPYFDKEDFALINLFIWLTYDNDAHAGNILAYPKEKNPDGFIRYGLKKIDNSLSFPEKNTDFFHFLMHFPHATHPVSSSIREKIFNIPLKTLEKSLEKFHLSSTLPAFKERVHVLQELAKRPAISYYEVSLRLRLLEECNGLELALSLLSLEDLEKLSPSFL